MSLLSENGSPLAFIQPFGNDICESWHEASSSAPIHDEALDALRSLEAEGKVVLLSAPRAGHGKTHLLGRVAARLQPASLVAALPWQQRDGLNWQASARGVLQDLATPGRSSSSSSSLLQETCAGVLAALLRKLVQSGQVPSANAVQVLRLLQDQPLQLFDPDGEARPLRDWFHAHFKTLRPRLAAASQLPPSPWTEVWLQRCVEAVALPTHEALPFLLRSLQSKDKEADHSAETLLHLIALWKPLVLVADHMDGLYRDAEAGMEVARMALTLTALPRVRVVLSVNQDLWDTTLGRQLPSAMQDRLSARNVALHGMDIPEAHALLELRLKEAQVKPLDAFAFFQFIDLEGFFATRAHASVTPRELLRFAARSWYRWLHTPAPTTHPASTITPAVTAFPSATEAAELEAELALAEADLERLTQSLREDEGGQPVDLSAYPAKLEEAPPGVVPLPKEKEVPWQGSFLLDDDDDDDAETEEEAPHAPAPAATPISTPHPPSPLVKLGEMIARLQKRQPTPPAAATPPPLPEAPPTAQAPAQTQLPLKPTELLDRFEELRAKTATAQIDASALRDVLRLAGERSAWIQHQEVELPGLSGQTIPRWSSPGLETVFGLAPLSHTEDWRLLASYIAGRLAEYTSAASQYGEPTPHLKWVVFTPDRSHSQQGSPLRLLFAQGIIPASLESHIDEVHLTEPQQADLLALRELAHEPSLASDPAMHEAWQNLLAERLEFFWRRLTRPLKASAS